MADPVSHRIDRQAYERAAAGDRAAQRKVLWDYAEFLERQGLSAEWLRELADGRQVEDSPAQKGGRPPTAAWGSLLERASAVSAGSPFEVDWTNPGYLVLATYYQWARKRHGKDGQAVDDATAKVAALRQRQTGEPLSEQQRRSLRRQIKRARDWAAKMRRGEDLRWPLGPGIDYPDSLPQRKGSKRGSP